MSVVLKDEQPISVQLRDLSPAYAEIMVLGGVLQRSGYFKDVRDQAQAVTKILCGRELGFSPIVSMQGIHIIEGKPALSSNLMATLIKRSGKYDYRVKSWNNTECILTFREKCNGQWEEVGESSFTMDDAKAAGVVRQGGSWSKFPKAMLFARALSQGMRTYCPDVSASPVYNPEELGAEVNQEGDVTELPFSARPVAVKKEPVSFKKQAPVGDECECCDGTGREKHGDSTRECYVCSGKGTMPKTSAPIIPDPDASIQKGVSEGAVVVAEAEPVVVASAAIEYITAPQQSNFHRECRKAVPEAKKLQADNLTYKWLADNHYVNEKGEPSAAMIPAAGWLEERHKACAWLKVQ